MEPYKGGFLADVPEEAKKIMKEYNPDKSVVSWAMRFVANLDDTCVVLTGASNLEQLENNIYEFKNADPLNDEELEILKKVSEIINSNITVDCTNADTVLMLVQKTLTFQNSLIYIINIKCLGVMIGHSLEMLI